MTTITKVLYHIQVRGVTVGSTYVEFTDRDGKVRSKVLGTLPPVACTLVKA